MNSTCKQLHDKTLDIFLSISNNNEKIQQSKPAPSQMFIQYGHNNLIFICWLF